MSDPTTKLSERLRELNHAWAEVLEETLHRTLPGEVDTFTDILTECIALAEAPPVSGRKPVDIPAMADELTAHLAKMKLPTDPHGWKTIVRIALIGKLSTLMAMEKEDTRRIACPRCMPPGDPCCPYCDGTYEINTLSPTKE